MMTIRLRFLEFFMPIRRIFTGILINSHRISSTLIEFHFISSIFIDFHGIEASGTFPTRCNKPKETITISDDVTDDVTNAESNGNANRIQSKLLNEFSEAYGGPFETEGTQNRWKFPHIDNVNLCVG